MKIKCYSVRLESLTEISPLCYKARSFDGSEDLIPKSQVLGIDTEVQKSNAYYISAWILEKKNIQYSTKKERWFDENGEMQPTYHVEHHKPEKKQSLTTNELKELRK